MTYDGVMTPKYLVHCYEVHGILPIQIARDFARVFIPDDKERAEFLDHYKFLGDILKWRKY